MSTALATQNTSIKAHAPEERYFTEEQMKLLSDHIMKGATAIELQYFGEVCKRVGLDPFKKQIHAVQRWSNEAKRMVWSYQTGIDGYVAIAHRGGLCAGIEDVQFLPADESTPNPTKATCTVWKVVAGQRVPFTASARWLEYVQCTKDGVPNSMWRKMPYGQLGKCAKALALRMAFPEEIGGILTDVEMEQADSEAPRGEHVKGRPPAAFDLESRPFEQPAIEAPKPEPKPAASPEPAKPQARPAEEPAIEAEVVTALAVPEAVAEFIHGKWKAVLGGIKGKELAEARAAALAGDNPQHAYAALGSIYDETHARLATKNLSETAFAGDAAAAIPGIGFPADLWGSLPKYPDILTLAKALK
jgi:phage recombination protein Bet